MRFDRKTRLWYRPGDQLILQEVPGVYGHVPVTKGDVLLDLGGHIGATTSMLLKKGVSKAIVLEADPGNVRLLKMNLKGKPATIIWAAVGPKAGRTPFYVRSDRTYVGSVLADPDRKQITVPMLPFAGLLDQFRPSIVKVDIEFAEYDLPGIRELPEFVKVVAMELSIRYVGIFTGRTMDADELRQRREAAADMIAAMEAQGFREVFRKTKLAKEGQPPADPDRSGFEPMVKALDVTWAR